jgi:hypothetical protein
VPLAVVDELELGATIFGSVTGFGEANRGAALVLAQPLAQAGMRLSVLIDRMRDAQGRLSTRASPLGELPENGGMLRIGDEILAYESRDIGSGTITIAERGMLGTDEQPHRSGESLTLLSNVRTTVLTADIGAGDADLPLSDLRGFPREGTLLVGRELLHYTRGPAAGAAGVAGQVAMPRLSERPGARDERGGGLFRGRYGTGAAAHAAGTPVVVFPMRYWDRWSDRADAPELSYFGFRASQEDAWWSTAFFEESEAGHAGPTLGMLARTNADAPWDEQPERTRGLWRFDGNRDESARLALGAQSDALELRVFVQYEPGSFDYDTGLAHGWKTTPRLRYVGTEYVAPRTVLFREDR